MRKVEGGSTIVCANRYYEKNTTSGEVTTYYYLGGQMVALRKGTAVEYVHADHLGGTSVSTDTTGATKSTVKYLPYGSTRFSTGTLGTDKKFTGQRLDGTGLYFYNARYYDASTGRFVSADPIVPKPGDPQALNRYAYVFNNPSRYTDESGHCPYCYLVNAAVDAYRAGDTASYTTLLGMAEQVAVATHGPGQTRVAAPPPANGSTSGASAQAQLPVTTVIVATSPVKTIGLMPTDDEVKAGRVVARAVGQKLEDGPEVSASVAITRNPNSGITTTTAAVSFSRFPWQGTGVTITFSGPAGDTTNQGGRLPNSIVPSYGSSLATGSASAPTQVHISFQPTGFRNFVEPAGFVFDLRTLTVSLEHVVPAQLPIFFATPLGSDFVHVEVRQA